MDGPVTDPEALWLLRKAKHAASPEEAAMLKRIAVIYDQRGKALYG